MENHAKNINQKLVPDRLLNIKNQKSHSVQEMFLKIRYFGGGLSKSFKKVNFIFSCKPTLC